MTRTVYRDADCRAISWDRACIAYRALRWADPRWDGATLTLAGKHRLWVPAGAGEDPTGERCAAGALCIGPLLVMERGPGSIAMLHCLDAETKAISMTLELTAFKVVTTQRGSA